MSDISDDLFRRLGGPRFVGVTRCTVLAHGDNHLMLSMPSSLTKDGSNRLRITLLPNKTLMLETFSAKPAHFKPVARMERVVLSMLREAFVTLTGIASVRAI